MLVIVSNRLRNLLFCVLWMGVAVAECVFTSSEGECLRMSGLRVCSSYIYDQVQTVLITKFL